MADEQEKDPFAGFKTTSAVDGVEVKSEPAPKSVQQTSVPPVDDEDDPLAEFSDQGDDNDESDADVADDDDGVVPDEEHDGSDGDDDSDPDDPDAGEEERSRRKPKVPAKARIAELTKARRDAEREAAALRARLEELEAKRSQADDGGKGDDAEADEKPAIVVKDEKGNTLEEPDPKKYKYGEVDSAYLRDLRKYDRLALKAEIAQEQEQTRQEQAAQRQAEELNAAREKLFEDGGSRYDDFETVVIRGAAAGAFALDQATFEMAAESEVGADILYHLAKNPATSVKVAQMNEREKARYLGRLEAALETRLRGKELPKERKGPRADPPPKSSTPRGRGGRFTNPASSKNFADFEAAWERSQQKR